MKSKLMIVLTFSAVFMATQMLASCASKADKAEATDNVEALSDAEQLNDSTADLQEVAEVEKTYPIGDRALYDVIGNVKSIVQGYSKMEFDENGLLKRSNAKTIKTGNGFEIHEEFFDEEYGETTEMVSKYDKDGRCISLGESEQDITYNDNNQIIRYVIYMGEGDCCRYTNTYDSDGFLLKTTYVLINNDEGTTTTSTKNYKVLSKDSNGNWTKRQVTEGSSTIVEERKIEYYQ